MTLPISGDLTALARGTAPDADPAAHAAELKEAAKQFEGLLVRELLKVLRKTAPEGGSLGGAGFSGDMYMEMFDDAIADKMSSGRGIGIAPLLERALGGNPGADGDTREVRGLDAMDVVPVRPGPPTGTPAPGATGQLQDAAREILAIGAEHWSRQGALDGGDLTSTFETQEAGGAARFNVRDARGYQGYYKCNLFAFELARRAGFDVPVVGRPRGWGYPVPNTITSDAADGQLRGNWGRVVTGQSAEALDQATLAGDRAFMLSGAAASDRAGHMAVVERVHEVRYDESGQVDRVVFDGWEARERGARHLVRRTWNRVGHAGGSLARNGFERIEIIELQRSSEPGGEVPISERAGQSNLDTFFSSQVSRDPIARMEE